MFWLKISVNNVLIVEHSQTTKHFSSVKVVKGLNCRQNTEQIATPYKLE